MRGVPPGSLRHLHGSRRTRRVADRLAVVLAGAAAGYGGDRGRPVMRMPSAPCSSFRRPHWPGKPGMAGSWECSGTGR